MGLALPGLQLEGVMKKLVPVLAFFFLNPFALAKERVKRLQEALEKREI